MIDPLPPQHPTWPAFGRDIYDEAIRMARQDLPDNVPLHWSILKKCVELVERKIREAGE